MPTSNQIENEIKEASSPDDQIRRMYLSKLVEETGRSAILYYSGWLVGQPNPAYAISDHDKIGFMSACNGIERANGLDLILHTPGGDIAATESIVDYLKNMFEDIRVIVPQLAMSAGTMIACSSNSILMGKQSSLGPFDPQINGIPAHGVIEEFEEAVKQVTANPASIPIWQAVIGKYPPCFLGKCQKSVKWSENMVREWLEGRMFVGDEDAKSKIDRIVQDLASHSNSLNHARHYSAQQCKDLGLKVVMMEDEQKLQDAVLSVHHATMHTISNSSVAIFKIIENHNGAAMVTT